MQRSLFLLSAALASLAAPVSAQMTMTRPQPLAPVNTVPAARDVPFPGTMTIAVDATDLRRGIYRVRQTVPVAAAGRMTMLYPEWLPGNHAPRGPIASIAGLRVTGNGQPIRWSRNQGYIYGFDIDVPAGVREIVLDYQHLSPTAPAQGRVTMTPDMLNLQWEKMSLYPAGYFVRNIPVTASVVYPAGWTAATSLDPAPATVATPGVNRVAYGTVSYEELVDSPVFAGRHFRKWALGPNVDMNVVADRPADLVATSKIIDTHEKLVDQAMKLFGAKHYDEYEFLLALTDELGGIGLEHLKSSENSHPRSYFTEWDKGSAGRDLLPHEFTHSWNGKYRRPADLFTPDYRQPTIGSLLWVYEGQTQFWGLVLAARSGIMPAKDVRDAIARVAAYQSAIPGRNWRALQDTTFDPVLSARQPKPFSSYQRSEDYYNEGALIWLDADAKLRELTRGRRGMDDFARAFFGVNPNDMGIKTYTLADVVATLGGIAPFDWAGFLDTRLNGLGAAPLDGLTRGGYRLAYTDTPSDWFSSNERDREIADLTFNIGATLNKDGDLTAVQWDGPLYNQGVAVSDRIVAVDGRAYKADDLKAAIGAAKTGRTPIRLLVKSGELFRTIDLAYYDGLRYPTLERTGSGPSSLDRLLAAK